MQRYFVPPEAFSGEWVTIRDEDAHHIQRVMRCVVGDRLIVCAEAEGRAWEASIVKMSTQEVIVQLGEMCATDGELPVPLWIAQCIPKGDKMDAIVQKVTELGAVKVIPVSSARTIVKQTETQAEHKRARWRRIAKEAAEQSGRAVIPVIERVHTIDEVLAWTPHCAYVLWCDVGATHSLSSALRRGRPDDPRPVLIVVGPEGGFAPEESARAETAGVQRVSLGPRILRTETAALFVLSGWIVHQEMEGRNIR